MKMVKEWNCVIVSKVCCAVTSPSPGSSTDIRFGFKADDGHKNLSRYADYHLLTLNHETVNDIRIVPCLITVFVRCSCAQVVSSQVILSQIPLLQLLCA